MKLFKKDIVQSFFIFPHYLAMCHGRLYIGTINGHIEHPDSNN